MDRAEPRPRDRERLATIPNLLSGLRLAAIPVFVALFVTGRETAAVALYAAAAWTDFFDGYIARRTASVTELGKLLDPAADRAMIVALCIALVARGTLPLWLAAAVVVRDALVAIVFPLLERRGIPRIQVNRVGKTATASLLFGLGWLAISETSLPLHEVGDEIGMVFVVLGAVLYWVAGALYARSAAIALRTVPAGRAS